MFKSSTSSGHCHLPNPLLYCPDHLFWHVLTSDIHTHSVAPCRTARTAIFLKSHHPVLAVAQGLWSCGVCGSTDSIWLGVSSVSLFSEHINRSYTPGTYSYLLASACHIFVLYVRRVESSEIGYLSVKRKNMSTMILHNRNGHVF